jgi:hypothetical protein
VEIAVGLGVNVQPRHIGVSAQRQKLPVNAGAADDENLPVITGELHRLLYRMDDLAALNGKVPSLVRMMFLRLGSGFAPGKSIRVRRPSITVLPFVRARKYFLSSGITTV